MIKNLPSLNFGFLPISGGHVFPLLTAQLGFSKKAHKSLMFILNIQITHVNSFKKVTFLFLE